MIRANLRLVVRIAHDYEDFGLPLLDLISEGNIGLIKAVVRFDPRKGGKLSTYAAWWIKQSMKRALANQSKTIRLPVYLLDKISRLRRAAAAFAEQFGREPSGEELALELGIPVNKVAHLQSVSLRPASLDAPTGDNGDSATFGEFVGDENAVSPFEYLRESNLKSDLNRMINSLERREADILRMRFGLDRHDQLTLEEVGRKFHITRERVRQLQVIALRKIRRFMAENEAQRSREELPPGAHPPGDRRCCANLSPAPGKQRLARTDALHPRATTGPGFAPVADEPPAVPRPRPRSRVGLDPIFQPVLQR
jgi:RNA polymerase primary sigma factor